MLKYFTKRLMIVIPMMLLISALVFFSMQLMPVDPISYLLSPDMAADSANIEALRESLMTRLLSATSAGWATFCTAILVIAL